MPVQHWSKRRLDDANQTLWGGWVVEGEGLRLIHTGDTGYSKDFRDIGERLGPFDMAFIPIGSYAPRWFMKVMHVDVPEAVQVRADLKAARAIGMHWGTFESLADEPLDEPPVVLARQRQERGLAPDRVRRAEDRRDATARGGGALMSRLRADGTAATAGSKSATMGSETYRFLRGAGLGSTWRSRPSQVSGDM